MISVALLLLDPALGLALSESNRSEEVLHDDRPMLIPPLKRHRLMKGNYTVRSGGGWSDRPAGSLTPWPINLDKRRDLGVVIDTEGIAE